MSKPSNSQSPAIEALLFSASQPLSAQRIGKSLGISEQDAQSALQHLQKELHGRGICVVQGADGYELAVAADYNQLVTAEASQSAPQLSQSSLEVLTIIAYDGPVGKSQIDEIRGTSSDSSLRALMSRDLIQTSNKSSTDGPRYDLTSLAWRTLGLTGRTQLPAKPKVADATE